MDENAELRARLERYERSISWRALQHVRTKLYGRIGEHSRAARAISAALRAGARLADRRRSAQGSIAVVPEDAAPLVSMILPVHAQPELTARLVRTLVATVSVPWELIVVDDTATPEVQRVVAKIAGARVVRNEHNLGYTASLNRGIRNARGEFVVLLNDDVIPQPGWLDAMLACAASSPDIGVVAPMYLDPEGRLKEAGSIVRSDGTAENFGRGDVDPDRARYRYRREIDYGSGACLLVRVELLRRVDGLDEAFWPAYYEDVDLCFSAREAGFRVLYEPAARVVHIEGATAGTEENDPTTTKSFQRINRVTFTRKWSASLRDQRPREVDARIACRRDGGPVVFVADHAIPSPNRDGGARRMAGLIAAFRALGYSIAVLPELEGPEADAQRLRDAGIEVLRPSDLQEELAALGPQMVLALLSRPQVAARFADVLREYAPAARLAYDTVDLHFRREERRAQFAGVTDGRRARVLRELELAMARSCDVTLVVSGEERELLLEHVPDATVAVVGTVELPVDRVAPIDARHGVVFFGSYLHAPNADAAVHLVRDVMPLVWRECPGLPVRLVGGDPPPEVRALAGPLVEVTGWVEDIDSVLDAARVCVVPMRYGAGLRIKSILAMARGLPVVSTSLGAEGIGGRHGFELLVGEDPAALAAHVVAVATDDALWQRLSEGGHDLVEQRFSPARVRSVLEALVSGEGTPAQPSRKA